MKKQILNVTEKLDIVLITISLGKENITIEKKKDQIKGNPDFLIKYLNKLEKCKKISKKSRIENLALIQKNPIFSIVTINNGIEKRIR